MHSGSAEAHNRRPHLNAEFLACMETMLQHNLSSTLLPKMHCIANLLIQKLTCATAPGSTVTTTTLPNHPLQTSGGDNRADRSHMEQSSYVYTT